MEGGDRMIISGLTPEEHVVMLDLLQQLDKCRRGNERRRGYMDAKRLPTPPPTVPPYLRNIGLVLGWPAKAVEALARRVKLTGFAVPGFDLETFGLDVVLDENEYVSEAALAQLSAMEHGVSWLVATQGWSDEPDVLITHQSALDATGAWSTRSRRLTAFLSVIERDRDGQPKRMNLYLPGQVAVIDSKVVVDRVQTGVPFVTAEPLVYRRRDNRPFGSSRITRPLMRITDSAVRTMLRSEGTADFYGVPLLALFGPDESIFKESPPLKMLMSSMFAVPDNEDASAGHERASIQQLTQASQQPHVDQLGVWAQLFAAEANIPVSSLGIGMTQANPTSADSYLASREDLISEAENAADGFSRAHARILRTAWMLREGEDSIPRELLKLEPIWRDARHESKASLSDWFVKVASVLPWVAEADSAIDLLGVDEVTAQRLRADKAKGRAQANLAALAAIPQVQDGSDGTVAG